MNDTLTVSGSLSKTNYFAGDTLSLSGLTFTATYNNGNTETVTPIVEGTLTEGQDSATVTYTNEYGTASATVTGFAVTAAPEMQQNVWYKVVNESQIQNGYKLILTYSNKTASSVYSEKYFQLSSTTFENEADGTIQNDNLPNNTIIFDIETTENGFKLNNNGNPLKSNSGDVSYASNATGDYEWYVTTEAGNILLTINDKGTIRYLTYRDDDVASSRIKPYPNTPLVQYDANNQYDVDYIDIYVCSEIVNNPEQGGNEGEQPGINPESPTFAGYEKITSAPDSWDGRYLIVYEVGSNAYVFNGQDAVNGHTKANIENEKFINKTSSLESNEVEIKTVSNGVSLKHANGYLYGKSGENSLNFNTSTSQVNKIEFTDGAVNIESNSTYLRFNNSSNQMRFRYYKSGQQTIQLYKFNGSSTPAPTPTLDSITAEPSNIEIYEGDTYNGTISVKGTYSNGSTETFTSDYTLKSNNTNFVVIEDNKIKGIAAGSTTVEVTYGGKSTELEVTVKAVESGGGNDNYTEQTANISITGSSGTKSSDNNSISWKLDAITITNTKGETAIRTSDTDHYRVYASSTLKFNSSKGKMKKIVVTCSSGYADDLKNSVGESATISGNVVTIEVDSIELIINITSQTRLTKVEVKYLG